MTITARLDNLRLVQTLIMEHPDIPDASKKKLCLAAEEVFVNICSYAYEGEAGLVEITLEATGPIVMTFRDEGRPFNPLDNPADPDDYDLDTQIGGLGRLIAFRFVDDVSYAYEDSRNVLVLRIKTTLLA